MNLSTIVGIKILIAGIGIAITSSCITPLVLAKREIWTLVRANMEKKKIEMEDFRNWRKREQLKEEQKRIQAVVKLRIISRGHNCVPE